MFSEWFKCVYEYINLVYQNLSIYCMPFCLSYAKCLVYIIKWSIEMVIFICLTVQLWNERDISGVWMEFPFFSMHSFNHFESSRTWQWVQISRRSSLLLRSMMVLLGAHGLASSKVHRTEERNKIVLLNLVYESIFRNILNQIIINIYTE